jgi:hypothetical protein
MLRHDDSRGFVGGPQPDIARASHHARWRCSMSSWLGAGAGGHPAFAVAVGTVGTIEGLLAGQTRQAMQQEPAPQVATLSTAAPTIAAAKFREPLAAPSSAYPNGRRPHCSDRDPISNRDFADCSHRKWLPETRAFGRMAPHGLPGISDWRLRRPLPRHRRLNKRMRSSHPCHGTKDAVPEAAAWGSRNLAWPLSGAETPS